MPPETCPYTWVSALVTLKCKPLPQDTQASRVSLPPLKTTQPAWARRLALASINTLAGRLAAVQEDGGRTLQDSQSTEPREEPWGTKIMSRRVLSPPPLSWSWGHSLAVGPALLPLALIGGMAEPALSAEGIGSIALGRELHRLLAGPQHWKVLLAPQGLAHSLGHLPLPDHLVGIMKCGLGDSPSWEPRGAALGLGEGVLCPCGVRGQGSGMPYCSQDLPRPWGQGWSQAQGWLQRANSDPLTCHPTYSTAPLTWPWWSLAQKENSSSGVRR